MALAPEESRKHTYIFNHPLYHPEEQCQLPPLMLCLHSLNPSIDLDMHLYLKPQRKTCGLEAFCTAGCVMTPVIIYSGTFMKLIRQW